MYRAKEGAGLLAVAGSDPIAQFAIERGCAWVVRTVGQHALFTAEAFKKQIHRGGPRWRWWLGVCCWQRLFLSRRKQRRLSFGHWWHDGSISIPISICRLGCERLRCNRLRWRARHFYVRLSNYRHRRRHSTCDGFGDIWYCCGNGFVPGPSRRRRRPSIFQNLPSCNRLSNRICWSCKRRSFNFQGRCFRTVCH